MEPRGPWTGLAQVVRFNWHLYVAAVAGEVALAVALVMLPHPAIWRVALVAAALPGLLWSAGSLLVSHWVYDRSDLYRWRWLAVMRLAPASWVSIHPGLDESSPALTALYGPGTVLDIFDSDLMPEPSIARARRRRAVRSGQAADHRHLPLATGSVDAVFLIFAAHELRALQARERLFAEVARVLRPGGRAVLVEHARDAWNVAAFGPGCLHFFSARSWRRVIAAAGLAFVDEQRITPFVRVFVAECRP